MPELPEVETVARLLRRPLAGRRIVGVRVPWERSLGGMSRQAFSSAVRGKVFGRVGRRAKYVVLGLREGGAPAGALLVHLRMSGRLHVDPAERAERPHTRVVLRLDRGRELRFLDVRKFGRFVFVADPEEALADLGPEPLSPDFDGEWLHAALRSKRRMLKPLLLDQSFLAGLGNIYVDESLHAARLHPETPSNRVSRRKAHELADAVRATLEEAIEREGSSFDTFYRTPEGNPGRFQDQFQVYGRAGRPCRRCGSTLSRIVVAQRGTHLCPRCQRVPRLRIRRPG
ncbi:MAG TPA: bifunctional DNA-formamidopyrimidine glycosylase/DNA-(apurinic or apyrimidinic site) lyase [Planctomycetes bacterium]|nr:bifunctional DNA-formamidopyrimidine glycosylase/DNA-(apurinic or apyrimidinic site) lyase [Planctomycetota bacterium]